MKKKNLILGLFLTSVLLISVVGMVSAAKKGLGEKCDSTPQCAAGLSCVSASVGTYAGQGYKCQPSIERGDVSLQGTTGTKDTSTRTSSIGTKTSTSSARTSSPGRNWVKAYTANNEECWMKSATSERPLFSGRFLGKLFE